MTGRRKERAVFKCDRCLYEVWCAMRREDEREEKGGEVGSGEERREER